MLYDLRSCQLGNAYSNATQLLVSENEPTSFFSEPCFFSALPGAAVVCAKTVGERRAGIGSAKAADVKMFYGISSFELGHELRARCKVPYSMHEYFEGLDNSFKKPREPQSYWKRRARDVLMEW